MSEISPPAAQARHAAEAGWLAGEGRWIVPLLATVAVLLAGFPAVRLLLAAVAPAGVPDLGPALAEIGGRAAVRATWNSLESALLSAVLATALGAAVAVVLTLTDVRAKSSLAFLFVMSMLMAPQVTALAFLLMTGPASPLLQMLALAPPPGTESPLMGRGGVILVLALHHAPLAFITVTAGLRLIPREVLEAGAIDGATGRTAIRWLVLPLLAPHLVAAALLTFVAAVGNFGIPALLGMPVNYLTLPTLIFRRMSSFGTSIISDAAALSVVVALIAMLAVLLAALVLRRHAVRAGGLEPAGACLPLGRARPLAEAALWLLVAAVLALPLASLLSAALTPAYGVRLTVDTVTLDRFVEVLWRQPVTLRALRNSAWLAGLAAVLITALAVIAAYGLDRLAGRWRRGIELLIEIPYALPGVVLGIACILLFLKPLPLIGVSLYATPWIILFAYLARFLPMAIKPALAGVSQLTLEQEEAAAVYGATFWQRLRYIVLPLILPSAAAGGLIVFLTAFNELTVSALLWSAGWETLGVALFNLEEAGLASEAAAVAVTSTAVIALAMAGLDRFRDRLPAGVLPWRA
jgi:iron(III) transport system permease protein